MADPDYRCASGLSSLPQLLDEHSIVHRITPEAAIAEMMRSAERLNVSEKVVHSHHMRRICPSRQENGDGYVRKLWRTGPSWDNVRVADLQIDLERVVVVLRHATQPGAQFSQRSLSAAAGEQRDCVGDIIRGRNLNPTLKTLRNLARALGGDLSVFGIEAADRDDIPTEAEIERALLDILPDMPRGGQDRRARYLAEGLARVLRLPQDRPTTVAGSGQSEAEEAALPLSTTN